MNSERTLSIEANSSKKCRFCTSSVSTRGVCYTSDLDLYCVVCARCVRHSEGTERKFTADIEDGQVRHFVTSIYFEIHKISNQYV